jgi:phosphatidylinositol alpha-mannosyltransferase
MQAAYPLLRPSLEKISARIAVSEDARRTVTTHLGGDAVVIPNGVFVERFASAKRRGDWEGTAARPTIAFLGRMEESRKGMPVLAQALPHILAEIPGVRVLIAGPGDPDSIRKEMTKQAAMACEFLGPVSDQDKASLLASVDVYVAPNTGGESFGIILIEAMSARATVLASDLPAFARVLRAGAGQMFRNGDPVDLAQSVVGLLRNPLRREELAAAGRERANAFDWSVVAEDVLAVYETVVFGASSVRTGEHDSRWARLRRSGKNSGGT